MRSFLLILIAMSSALPAFAANGNAVERAQNNAEQRNDWRDLQKLTAVRREIAARDSGAEPPAVSKIDSAMRSMFRSEWGEDVFERERAGAEKRRSRREAIASGSADDRRDLRDDRRDQRRERVESRKLVALGERYRQVVGDGSAAAMAERLAIVDALITMARGEVREGRRERREDRRERREDRRRR